MKAWRLKEFDKPLKYEEIPDPEIKDPTDVIIKIGGAGVCRTDLHLIEGVWDRALETPLPFTIGHENAGWVHQKGSGVTMFDVGDPVIVHPVASCGKCLSCRAGEDMHCENLVFPGLTTDGGYAEYLKTSERALIKLENDVKPEEVAPLADAGITAYRAVQRAAPLAKPGTKTLLMGMGGLGHIAVQLMREFGNSDIIALDTNEERLNMALEYGADHGVVAKDGMIEEVLNLSNNGNGIDLIIDLVGEDDTHANSMKMLKKGGSYFVVGYGGVLHVPSLDVINNEFSIIGSLVGNYNQLYELMQMHAKGKVRLHSTTYPMSKANEVLKMLDEGKINGRTVLVP
ncbi:NAD(P)-dependent alcohol dehydrogenase [Salicibibacter cibarius]|uniref:Alcohol dehydrogenase n=1 Tax=Salicibibacter cibarius TaxID=2743000 RepID=A0A7T6Z414_9BACI|nr:NAD(P)-dependent alcohol dehydrogenase [Salicibibacter cibarius]QQK76486.1 NAD(P)-dependent alcohol dehydrogenase [Salicibibacter cibarius]